jgi:hypothetical protein
MSEYVQFKYRQLDPNLASAAGVILPGSPDTHLAASLKGGAAIVTQDPDDRVKLSAVLGWVSNAGANLLRVSIYRDASYNEGGTLIFSTLDATDPGGNIGTVSIVHVDAPGTTGIVNYFLEVSMELGTGMLIGPLTFIGEVIHPLTGNHSPMNKAALPRAARFDSTHRGNVRVMPEGPARSCPARDPFRKAGGLPAPLPAETPFG